MKHEKIIRTVVMTIIISLVVYALIFGDYRGFNNTYLR